MLFDSANLFHTGILYGAGTLVIIVTLNNFICLYGKLAIRLDSIIHQLLGFFIKCIHCEPPRFSLEIALISICIFGIE